jgi:hypothetical protein
LHRLQAIDYLLLGNGQIHWVLIIFFFKSENLSVLRSVNKANNIPCQGDDNDLDKR